MVVVVVLLGDSVEDPEDVEDATVELEYWGETSRQCR